MSRFIRTLLPAAILAAVATAAAAAPLKLPYGPEGKGRFGAYYTTLSYSPEWDSKWRVGPKADVVVRFDDYDYRLVFWRGTNYMPFWVNEKRVWVGNGSVGMPHTDSVCRYCFASVIESNDARVVVRWRYAPLDMQGNLLNADEITGWHDWVDEYYTIYPDAVGVRAIKAFSSKTAALLSCQESIMISNPGQKREWKRSSHSGNNTVVHSIDGASPFLAVSTEETDMQLRAGYQEFAFQADAPPAYGWPAHGTTDPAYDRPGVGVMGKIVWKPYAEDKQSKSWMMLTGLTDGKAVDPETAAKSWRSAPVITVTGCRSQGYDQTQRAYLLSSAGPADIKLSIAATKNSPSVNPAFVIKNWGKRDVTLAIDGKPIERGPDFRCGFRKTAESHDLILWIKNTSTKALTLAVRPVEGGR